ncbi:MAG: hypothetical protein WDM89_11530 [Rhizomicrobium sp.]
MRSATGESTFSLHLGDASGAANGPHLYFECVDLDTRVAELRAKGIVFDSGHVDQTWLWPRGVVQRSGRQSAVHLLGGRESGVSRLGG